jgi:serine/threonine protein kinase
MSGRVGRLDTVFVLRTLHHVATGLKQLHRANIAHQDLKPSNVLVYSKEGSKICDLGRAWDRNLPSQHDALPVPGDPTYATIECLYDSPASTEDARRYGCDFYHLGNLVVFFFTRARANSLLLYHVNPIHYPDYWGGTFEEVLPYLQAGFGASLATLSSYIPECVRDDLIEIVTELCEPDPKRRGHPRNRLLRQFSLDYYVSRFDRLAHRAELDLVA